MPIRAGDHPFGDPGRSDGLNKFMTRRGDEGHRGTLIAVRKDGLEGVVVAWTSGGGVNWGKLYLIKETHPNQWPRVVRRIDRVPNSRKWSIVAPDVGLHPTYEYDVCLSFAGEDRAYVKLVAEILVRNGGKVFYDDYETAGLWGKNLYEHLSDIYQHRARYCVMFISRHYGSKVWPSHERRAAQARALSENTEYILPARFDDTEVPGMLPTTAYLPLWKMTPDMVADSIAEKLGWQGTTLELTFKSMPPWVQNGSTAAIFASGTVAHVTGTMYRIGVRNNSPRTLRDVRVRLTKCVPETLLGDLPLRLRAKGDERPGSYAAAELTIHPETMEFVEFLIRPDEARQYEVLHAHFLDRRVLSASGVVVIEASARDTRSVALALRLDLDELAQLAVVPGKQTITD